MCEEDQQPITINESNKSPLDVEGVSVHVTIEDIIACIHESRKVVDISEYDGFL